MVRPMGSPVLKRNALPNGKTTRRDLKTQTRGERSDFKCHVQCDSDRVTLPNVTSCHGQNCGDREKAGGCQGLAGGGDRRGAEESWGGGSAP